MALASGRARDEVRFLSEDEGRAYFDEQAQRLMRMSGEEFITKYDSGQFNHQLDNDTGDEPGLAQLVMLLPFGR